MSAVAGYMRYPYVAVKGGCLWFEVAWVADADVFLSVHIHARVDLLVVRR
jgi:hypothetical protein